MVHHFRPTCDHSRSRWGRRDPVRPVSWSEPLPAHLPSLAPSQPHPDPRPSCCSLAPQGCCYLRALDSLFSTWNPFPGGLPAHRSLLHWALFWALFTKTTMSSPATPVLPAPSCFILFLNTYISNFCYVYCLTLSIRIWDSWRRELAYIVSGFSSSQIGAWRSVSIQ